MSYDITKSLQENLSIILIDSLSFYKKNYKKDNKKNSLIFIKDERDVNYINNEQKLEFKLPNKTEALINRLYRNNDIFLIDGLYDYISNLFMDLFVLLEKNDKLVYIYDIDVLNNHVTFSTINIRIIEIDLV